MPRRKIHLVFASSLKHEDVTTVDLPLYGDKRITDFDDTVLREFENLINQKTLSGVTITVEDDL